MNIRQLSILKNTLIVAISVMASIVMVTSLLHLFSDLYLPIAAGHTNNVLLWVSLAGVVALAFVRKQIKLKEASQEKVDTNIRKLRIIKNTLSVAFAMAVSMFFITGMIQVFSETFPPNAGYTSIVLLFVSLVGIIGLTFVSRKIRLKEVPQ